jgi:hypothetical protein
LGGELAKVGRFPHRRRSLALHLLTLTHWFAAPEALISAEVVPFRPHRGVVLVVEEGEDDERQIGPLLEVPGVAGVWTYGDDPLVTVIYLDAEPLATTKALTPLVQQRWATGARRPLFAGPLRTMVEWEAWPD